jgi:hypothetical protein
MISGLRKLADKLEKIKIYLIVKWNNFLDTLKICKQV